MKRYQFTFIGSKHERKGSKQWGLFTAIREGASEAEAFGKLFDEFRDVSHKWNGVEWQSKLLKD